MSPNLLPEDEFHLFRRRVDKPTNPDGLILEAWAQGYMVGSLIIMSCITLANMRRGVVLHKLILIELLLGIWHGFWIFFNNPIYSWWLSVSAIFLNMSWSLHNVIAWMKIKPFLSRTASLLFIGTVILVQPYWVVEIYANFTYFHNINTVFLKTRPWEALCRDPWWIFTSIALLYNIHTRYELSWREILRISPRFGLMVGAMILSIVFIIVDVLSVTSALQSSLPVGINPFWKLSYVFKCLTDTVILDDFKTALDRLRAFKMSRLGTFDMDDSDNKPNDRMRNVWDAARNGPPATASTAGDHHTKELPDFPPDFDIEKNSMHGRTGVQSGYGRAGSKDRDSEEDVRRLRSPPEPALSRGLAEAHAAATLQEEALSRGLAEAHAAATLQEEALQPRASVRAAAAEYARAVKEVMNETTGNNAGRVP